MASSGSEAREMAPPQRSAPADRERAEELVLWLVGSQADSLLRVARRLLTRRKRGAWGEVLKRVRRACR
jgi:hypothetical protein